MFGKSNENKSPSGKTLNLFSDGTTIKGDIKTNADIRIDGIVEGLVYSDSKVVIGTTGKVKGDVICRQADISGNVVGLVSVKETLFLKSSAIIDGDVVTQKLVVESGAVFNGKCSMHQGKAPEKLNHERKVAPAQVLEK